MAKRVLLDAYLTQLSARSPVPGGGSAAALVGAVGVSLLSMVAVYTAKRYRKKRHRRLVEIMTFSASSRRRLRRLMAKDEAAYSKLSKASKSAAAKDLETLFKDASLVPGEVCEIVHAAILCCQRLSVYCSKGLASDLAEAAVLLEAAFISARCNVDINLRYIKDSGYKKRMRHAISKRRADVRRRVRKIGERLNIAL